MQSDKRRAAEAVAASRLAEPTIAECGRRIIADFDRPPISCDHASLAAEPVAADRAAAALRVIGQGDIVGGQQTAAAGDQNGPAPRFTADTGKDFLAVDPARATKRKAEGSKIAESSASQPRTTVDGVEHTDKDIAAECRAPRTADSSDRSIAAAAAQADRIYAGRTGYEELAVVGIHIDVAAGSLARIDEARKIVASSPAGATSARRVLVAIACASIAARARYEHVERALHAHAGSPKGIPLHEQHRGAAIAIAAITARSIGIAALAVRHNREALIETGIAPGHDDPRDPTITITAAAPGLPTSTRTAGKDVHGPAGGQIAARQNYLRAAAQRFAAQLIAIAAFGRRSEEDRGQARRRIVANFDACRTGKGIAADFTRSAIGIRGEIDIARGVELRTCDNPDRCQTAASDTAIARARSATATIAGEIDRGDGRATVDIERGLAPSAVATIARRSRATVAMRRTGERIGDQRTTDNAETRCAPRTVSAGRPIAAESIGQCGDVACSHQRTIGEDRG